MTTAGTSLPQATPIVVERDRPSLYQGYLPSIFKNPCGSCSRCVLGDRSHCFSVDFLRRFLLNFEDLWGPIERLLDCIHYYFDPALAPSDFLSWLAFWVDLVLDKTWPEERRRLLLRSAAELYRWRGTKRGLAEYLRIYTGVDPEITEFFGSVTLGEDYKIGVNSLLGEGQPHTFLVTLRVNDSSAVNLTSVRRIIEEEKPAHTAYFLKIVERDRPTES